MANTQPHILLLGGHGAVSLLLTPKLISRSWHVTSVIRNPDQRNDISEAAGKARTTSEKGLGKIDILVASLEEVKSENDAQRILTSVKPDWVVWSAGAGGKGGPSRTNAIDRDACIHFIRSAVAIPSITKFLVVSYLGSRRSKASWWSEAEYQEAQKFNLDIAPAYYKAKLAADEVLTVLGTERAKKDGFGWIDLRPGTLTNDAETGQVQIGKTTASGKVTRGDVAEVTAQLLEKDGARGWFDLLGGKDDPGTAVQQVLETGFDSVEGEDLEAMRKDIGQL